MSFASLTLAPVASRLRSLTPQRQRGISRFLKALLLVLLATAQPSHGRLLRSMQERMLKQSLDRAQLNYGIVFTCRKTEDIRTGPEVNFMLQLGDLRGFRLLDRRKKLALFLHGWNDEGSKEWVQDLLRTWTYFAPNYNVCVVDWGHLSQADYKSASMSIFDVGLTVAGIIMALEQLRPRYFSRENVTIAGYSLGAHAAGHAGAALNGELEQIIGLDPAGPLFTLPATVSEKYRLDASDAQFVQVLHTSSGSLGTSMKSGHADFYPNGGSTPQSNCSPFAKPNDLANSNIFGCSHSTAAVFFKQSMNPAYPFMGHHCASYSDYTRGKCFSNRRGRFGIHSQRLSEGDFYFTTQAKAPYVERRGVAARGQARSHLRWRLRRKRLLQRRRFLQRTVWHSAVASRQINSFS